MPGSAAAAGAGAAYPAGCSLINHLKLGIGPPARDTWQVGAADRAADIPGNTLAHADALARDQLQAVGIRAEVVQTKTAAIFAGTIAAKRR